MKRFLSFFLAVLMVGGVIVSAPFTNLPLTVKANAAEAEVLTFMLNEDGQTYRVSDCADTATGNIAIPDSYAGYPVTAIGDYAFYGCEGITNVIIPEGVVNIGDSAFENCSALITVTIPSTVTYIGFWAFYQCTALERVHISDLTAWCNIDFVGETDTGECCSNPLFYARNLFVGDEKVETLVVPEVVTFIKAGAFINSSIKDVVIPEGVESIGYYAFGSADIENVFYKGTISQWEDINIYGGNNSIEDSAVHYETSTHVPCDEWILNGFTCDSGEPGVASKVCVYCDYVCVNKEVSAGHSIVNEVCEICGHSEYSYYIEDDGVIISGYFGDDTTVVIPDKLGDYTVKGIETLGYYDEEGYYVDPGIEHLTLPSTISTVEGWLFCDNKSLKTVIIPDGVKSIGSYAFYGCSSLTRIDIPNSVTEIGEAAFFDCTSLKNVNLPLGLNKIENSLFENCTSLENANIDFAESIGDYAFYNCKKLKEVEWGGRLKAVGDYAFAYCESIESVEIPAQLHSISADVFYGCKSLEDISVSLFNPLLNVVDGVLFNQDETQLILFPAALAKDTYTIPATVTGIDYGAFAYCTGVKSIIITKGLKTISSGAFLDCTSLESVTIPGTVTDIGSSAFHSCSSLKSLDIPDGIITIGMQAFALCTSLESINIPKSVTNIGFFAFFDCLALKTFNVSEENKKYATENNVLFNKSKTILYFYAPAKTDKTYTIPDSVTEIFDSAFENAKNLEKVVVGENVKVIGWGAFSGCEKLATITLPDTVFELGGYAFSGTAYYMNSGNWEDGALYVGKHLASIDDETISEDFIIKDGTINIAGYLYSDKVKLIAIPSSVLNVGEDAFCNFCVLELILVDVKNPNYSATDGVLYNKDKTQLIRIPYNKYEEKFYVPDTVTGIFKNNLDANITHFYIPDSVTYIDYQNFWYPYNLIICYEGTQQQWNRIETADAIYTKELYFETYDIGEMYILPENEGPYIKYRVRNDKTAVLEKFELNGDYDVPLYYEIPSEVAGYPITAIGENLFKDNGLLYSITIPDGVKEIGAGAFYNCYNLKKIKLPDSLETIGEEAFKNSRYYNTGKNWEARYYNDELNDVIEELKNIGYLPKNWTPGDYHSYLYQYFGSKIYNYSKALYIGKHLIEIRRTFDNDVFFVKKGTLTIAKYAVRCYIEKLFIPASLVNISENKLGEVSDDDYGYYDDYYNSTNMIVVVDEENQYYTTEDDMLMDKEKTQLIHMPYNKEEIRYVPDTVKYINDFTLKGMVVLPETIKYIGTQFSGWGYHYEDSSYYQTYLIAYPGTQERWERIEGYEEIDNSRVHFEKVDMGKLWLLPSEKGPFTLYMVDENDEAQLVRFIENGNYDVPFKYDIPDYTEEYEITSIGSGCFNGCGLIYAVSIPQTVRSIGDRAFYYCFNLSSISLPNSIKEIGYSAFYGTAYYKDSDNWVDDELYINNHLIKAKSIESCEAYTLKSRTKGIASGAFGWCEIDTLTIPEGVRSISSFVFDDCYVQNLVLPESVSYIGRNNFNGGTGYIFYMGSEMNWADIEIAEENQELEDGLIHFGTTEHTLEWREVNAPTTSSEGLRVHKCIICDYIHEREYLPVLSGYNFVANSDGTYKLASYLGYKAVVEIPSTNNDSPVTIIGNSCFKDNGYVRRVVIPDGVKEIGYLAFMNCSSLESVSIPATVTSIGTKAFYGFTGTIYCQRDSFAHRYAIENNIKFIIPTIEPADDNTRIDFDNQIVFTTINGASDIADIIKAPSTVTVLPTPSIKTEQGEFYGTGSTITVFDGDTFLGDYVIIIEGDLNGDSVCDVLDASAAQLCASSFRYATQVELYAANGDTSNDFTANSYQNVVNQVLIS